jgi:hypothetical protein
MTCIGDFLAPATHVTFLHDVAHELNSVMVNKWDAYESYRELFFRPVEVADSVLACEVARRILHADNGLISENTVLIVGKLLLDYCKQRVGRPFTLEELAGQNDVESIRVYGTFAAMKEADREMGRVG